MVQMSSLRSESSVEGRRTRKLMIKIFKAQTKQFKVQNKKLDVLVNHLCKKKKISSQKSESVRSDKESNQLLIYESDSKDDELSSLKSDDVDSTKATKVD